MDNTHTPEKEVIDVPPEDPKAKETAPPPLQDVQIVSPRSKNDLTPGSRRMDHNVVIGTVNVTNATPTAGQYLSAPLRRRYHKHYHSRHKYGRFHLVADIFLVLIVAGLLTANIYTEFFLASRLRERVQLVLATTPEKVVSGDLVTLTFFYKNDNDVALTDAHLSILLPKYFLNIIATPASFDERTHTFSLGRIAAGGNGVVELSGKLIGSVGTDIEAGAVLSYGREGATIGRRDESKGVSFTIPVLQSTIRLSLDFPDDIVHEGTAPFVVRYENMGKPPIAELVLRPNVRDTFSLSESAVPLTDGVFRIQNIAQGGRGEIRGQLAIRAQGEEAATFVVQAFVDGTTLLQGEAKKTSHVFYPKVVVSPIHDSTHDAVVLGSATDFSFTYTNNEREDILDLTLVLDPPSSLFTRDAKTITTMTKREDPSLSLVRVGAKGTVLFTLPLKTTIDRTTLFGTGDPVIRIPYTVSYRLASAPDRLIQFDKMDVWKVQSDLAIDAFGRYYTPEGDQLGRGSLPPRAGETTRYWIFIPLTNTFSDVADVVVTATLGSRVEWTRKSSITLGDPLAYDERTRVITWRLAKVTKFSGGAWPDVGAAIEVAFTPSIEDIGTEPVLLTDIRIRGRDAFTNTTIERQVPPVTTLLSVDKRANGRSKVVR